MSPRLLELTSQAMRPILIHFALYRILRVGRWVIFATLKNRAIPGKLHGRHQENKTEDQNRRQLVRIAVSSEVRRVGSAISRRGLGFRGDDYRGGWKTETNGTPRIYQFSIRGATVRGVYCSWCNDATTLAFVDGNFGPAGITFKVTHVDNNILHEDWGDYSIPFDKHVAARVSNNEMRAVFYQDNLPPELAARGQQTDPGIAGTTLIGPIPHEATATNRWK